MSSNNGFPCSIAIDEDVWLLLRDDDMLVIDSSFDIDYVFASMVFRIGSEGSSDGVVLTTAILGDHCMRSCPMSSSC
ncbi:hypothetical protein H5410_034782 [Solanum commersonii]|uniref:Uncharacterized protein n=1 Tax=Solanum commersonii TaxID=4109 RepID=A0A9J5YWF6_SOLCO|nr:hypothetical protein H5410_034782 [Solanum commersonii]